MTYKTLLVEIRQGVGIIWMNRPERRNALDETMIEELNRALIALQGEAAVRAVVLAGAGECFCTGADRDWLKRQLENSPARNRADARSLAIMLDTLQNLSKPTIARVQGLALDGGGGLVAACDLAVGDYNAEFQMADVRVGLIPAAIAPYLIRAMGERGARRYCLSGEIFPAAEAYRIGLLTDIVPPQELDARINELLGQLLLGAPNAQALLKDWARIAARNPITPDLIEKGAGGIADICASDEFQRGLSDFFAKRKPHWLPTKKRAAGRTKAATTASGAPKPGRNHKKKA